MLANSMAMFLNFAVLLISRDLLVDASFVGPSCSTFQSRHSSAVLATPREEAEALIERARKMREEVAGLEGRPIEQVEAEAKAKRENRQQREEAVAASRQAKKEAVSERKTVNGSFLSVPETFDDQVYQAKQAVERACKEGVTRQVIRFALVPPGDVLNEDRQWPGGAQQMYREAAGPLTRELLRQVRVSPTNTSGDTAATSWTNKPNVTSQDIWDFDGSAWVAATYEGTYNTIQAMVLPNTDNKYTLDIQGMSESLGMGQLLILVNPFWRDVESWGFNLLAPKAKALAQEIIFDSGFEETYVLLQKSIQGEDCIALKAFPYDWQLFAYAETDYWPYDQYIVHLGSTAEEPKSTDFVPLLQQREEFRLSKNMRQMQRMLKKDE
jgi:hypothetical protein